MSVARRTTVERVDSVAVVRLAGPAGKAVMDSRFFDELAQVSQELGADDGVRAVVVRAEGRDFSFGLDLREAGGLFGRLLDSAGAAARLELMDLIRAWQGAFTALAECPKPTIASITGWCVGGGVDLASACDVRVASVDATFSIREARMAIVADLGSLQRLVGVIGDGHLRELALTGEDFDAERARSIGLVNSVHPDHAATHAAAHDIARRMAANSPLVLRGVKAVLDEERGRRVEAGLRYTAVWNSAFLLSEDLTEALAAFRETREPRFSGG